MHVLDVIFLILLGVVVLFTGYTAYNSKPAVATTAPATTTPTNTTPATA